MIEQIGNSHLNSRRNLTRLRNLQASPSIFPSKRPKILMDLIFLSLLTFPKTNFSSFSQKILSVSLKNTVLGCQKTKPESFLKFILTTTFKRCSTIWLLTLKINHVTLNMRYLVSTLILLLEANYPKLMKIHNSFQGSKRRDLINKIKHQRSRLLHINLTDYNNRLILS